MPRARRCFAGILAFDWSAHDVFAGHALFGLPLHEAYHTYGATRLSCRFCILASRHDLAASTRAPTNLDHYRHLVAMEADSTFSFQPSRWLADIAPDLLSETQQRAIDRAKLDATERRRLEAAMPADLRFVKGLPPRLPTPVEADAIAAARTPILARHHLPDRYPTASSVRERFAELLAQKAQRLQDPSEGRGAESGEHGKEARRMKIELRKLQIAKALSEESTAYSAEIWIDGERAFLASNRGTGGCDFYQPVGRYSVQEVDDWLLKNRPPAAYHAVGLPVDLETEVAMLMDTIEITKRLKRLMRTNVVAIKNNEIVSYALKGQDAQKVRAVLLARNPDLAILDPADSAQMELAVSLVLAGH